MDKEDKPEDKKFHCETCKKTYSNISALNKHFKTASHLLNLENADNDKLIDVKAGKGKTKIESEFYCPLCDYEQIRKDYFANHLESIKHKKNVETYEDNIKNYQDKDELEDALTDLEHFKIKIGVVKDDILKDYKIVSKGDIEDMFRIDEYLNLKTHSYPKTIKQTKHKEGEKPLNKPKKKKIKKKLKI